MNICFTLLWMIMMHIVDDYYLQGILAKMKQKSWWEENAPQDLYKKDYIIALIMHAFSWAFCVMLPMAIFLEFKIEILFIVVFILNVVIHAFVDNLKANKKTINLWDDQMCHISQIWFTFMVLWFWG